MLEILEETLKRERESQELSHIEEDFFFKLQEHINALTYQKDPISKKELQLIEGCIEELVGLRAEKVIKGHHHGMLREESKLAEFRATFQKFKKDVTKSLLQRDAETQRVIILQDLPQFYGPELEVLGPYKKDEVVLLDKTVATLLKEKGLIEER